MSCCNRQDICIKQGDDLRVIVDVVDDDSNPIDITDAQSIKWAVGRKAGGTVLILKSLSSGITVNTPTSFMFDIESEESELLAGSYYHEVEIINNSGLIYTPLFGTLTVQRTLIKPE